MAGPDKVQQQRLEQLAQSCERAKKAHENLARAIVRASEVGCSLRKIAAEARVSHEQVRRILKDAQS